MMCSQIILDEGSPGSHSSIVSAQRGAAGARDRSIPSLIHMLCLSLSRSFSLTLCFIHVLILITLIYLFVFCQIPPRFSTGIFQDIFNIMFMR